MIDRLALITYIVHDHELVWMYTYREPEYDRFGLGYRLLDFSVDWATQAGYRKIDLGGGHEHFKSKWGPKDGAKWEIRICPELDYRAKAVARHHRPGQIGGQTPAASLLAQVN